MKESEFDPKFLLTQVGNNNEILIELTSTFFRTYHEKIVELKDSIHQKDPKRLLEAAHYIKGDLTIMGDAQAVALAQKLEDLGSEDSVQGAETLSEELEKAVQPILEYIKKVNPSVR